VIKLFLYIQWKRAIRQYDVIHAQSFFDAGIYTHWLSRKFKIKSVLTEHNQLNFLDSKFNRKTIKNALNSFDTRIAVSNDVVRQFASTGFFNDFAVIGNPLDDVFLEDECVSTKTECDNQVVLVHAGAFTSIKNQTLILDLIKKLDNDGLKVKFNWIGVDSWGVDTRKVVKIEIDGRQYSDNIEICVFGRMSKQQMLEIYKSSHLAIATSICETFGISSLEAMSTGLPLLSTQNGGVSEFANSENSILVPINDINGLYKGFMKWYNNRNNFDKKRIADNIKQNFSPQLFAEKMNNIYNR
jgi:glycosyltransferase involved in cell wall biosynthesis